MVVGSLSDLMRCIKKEGKIEVIEFNGYHLVTSIGRFLLDNENLWLDGKSISKKDLDRLLSPSLLDSK